MQSSNIKPVVRFLLSAIFLMSGIGKLIDIPVAAFSLAQLFFLPKLVAHIAVVILSVVEIGLAAWIWWRAPKILLAVPVGFAIVLGYSYWKGSDCGCFGSLPLLEQFPLGGHILLILGIFAGIYYLSKSQKVAEAIFSAKSGIAAIVLIVMAFFTLPFSDGQTQAVADESIDLIVDRAYVEQAIAENSAVIIDARDEMQFLFGHIEGAINIFVDGDGIAEIVDKYNLKNKALITYCTGVHCDMADRLTKKLQELGCKNIKIYAGGWEEWAMESY